MLRVLAWGAVTIGVLRDSAFTFYYPDNLEALERLGARLVVISALADQRLADVDALYIGGGFPETHAAALASNRSLMGELRQAAAMGMPMYAECGGLMYLSRGLRVGGREHEMAGVLPVDTVMEGKPVGHGYVEATVAGGNGFYEKGTKIVGHEFHYSRVISGLEGVELVLRMHRGAGIQGGAEGLRVGTVLGTYIHVHAVGMEAWARGMVGAAAAYRDVRALRRG